MDGADFAPEGRRVVAVQLVDCMAALEQGAERAGAGEHRGFGPFDAERGDRRSRLADPPNARKRGDPRRQMRRARDLVRAAQPARHRLDGRLVVEPVDQHRPQLLRRGQDLDRDLGHRRERSPGAREQLAEVVAGDVLDHPPARLEHLAAAADRAHAEKMVARGACLEAARTREIGRHAAAERRPVGLRAEQRSEIRRLEGENLAVLRQPGCDLGKRGAGPRGEHQLLRLVKRDPREAREVEPGRRVARAAEPPLRPAGDEFERMLAPACPADCFDHVVLVGRAQGFHRGIRSAGCRETGSGRDGCGPGRARRSDAAPETPFPG